MATREEMTVCAIIQHLAWTGGFSTADIIEVIGPAVPDLTEAKISEILAGPDCRTIKPPVPKGY